METASTCKEVVATRKLARRLAITQLSTNSTNNRTMYLFYLTILLVLSTASGGRASSCPANCTCYAREVWCESKGFTSVPTDIPVDTRMLYLFDNRITTIPEGSLSRLQDLQLLDLSSNQLSNRAIRPGVFSNFRYLSDLNLSENRISSITTDTFSGIDSLVRLYLKNNLIKTIERGALGNMSNLVELKLSNNMISNFPRIVDCPKLQRLCLADNRLARLQPGSLAQVNLEQLTLSGNRLNQLPSTIFRHTSNMRELDISGNNIARLPWIIRNMTSLQTLNLSSNVITSLESDLLTNLRNMKTLDLHNMRLTTLNKHFIPRGVFLNVFDISENPWRCNCSLAWLSRYMNLVQGAFVHVNNVKCNQPSSLRNHLLLTLHQRDFNCQGDPTRTNNPAPNQPPQTPPRRKPTVDVCDGMACANGATCFINQTTLLPACGCLPGWKGLLCDKPIIRPRPPTTTTTTRTPATSDNDKPQLMIRTETLTTHTVDIILPTVGKQMALIVTEVSLNDGTTVKTTETNILPDRNPYTVTSLEAGKKYKICISSNDVVYSSAHNSRGRTVEDRLCGEVTMLQITTEFPQEDNTNAVPPDNGVVDNGADKPEINPKNNEPDDQGSDVKPRNGGLEPVANTTDDAEFQLLYPALGAGLGAFIILVIVILFFVCYRNKKKVKQASNNIDEVMRPQDYKRKGKATTVQADAEMVPMVGQQRLQYVPQPSTQLLAQNGDVYSSPQHNYSVCGQSPQRVGTPNKTESLGRSSTSGGSVSGSQMAYIDMQRNCSTTTGTMYSVASPVNVDEMRSTTTPNGTYQSNGGVYNGHVPYTNDHGPILSSRGQEFVYMHHGSPGLPPETFADTCFREPGLPTVVVPVRSTSTTVNQYHQGPIATTTVSPESSYHHMNSPVTMPGYQTRSPMARPQHVPMHYTPNKQLRFQDMRSPNFHTEPYGPSITSAHMMDNGMGHVFHDTMVM